MGAIAAVKNRLGENAVPTVLSMIERLEHRGADAHGVATPASRRTTDSIKQLNIQKMDSDVALGHSLCRFLPEDLPQPVSGQDFTLVFEGRLFPRSTSSDLQLILDRLPPDPEKNSRCLIDRFDGSYAFAVACGAKIVAGRDALGTTSLYYGADEINCAIASERKALWTIGIDETEPFPPGNLAQINSQGFTFQPIKIIRQPPPKPLELKTAANHLRALLQDSVKRRVSDIKEVAVAFSGGLDSSVIAMLAKACGAEVHLITVGLEGQRELRQAKAAAQALELPLHFQTYNEYEVKDTLPKVLWLIEEPDVMKAGVAIPVFWTAEIASKLGFHILLAGQGADELFAGYHRYLKDYATHIEVLRSSLYHDITTCYETNFQRDNQACSFHKVELRLPFADQGITNFSLSLPVSLKIRSSEDHLRKWILRQTAQDLGLPKFIVNRPKKAVQYASGVDKTLRRLAKRKGLPLSQYFAKTFLKVYPERRT